MEVLFEVGDEFESDKHCYDKSVGRVGLVESTVQAGGAINRGTFLRWT